ncbi:hypothetical protein AB986_16005 [Alkalihalobacillus macyae]|uniref:Uncharacterized protein n=2 Tax=Guptibacillus hwajinpoensis TaxID=208199 RepID=A0A0J6CZ96_9BACL|nr:hypothetical protein AB986_16005 [Alkalihalobacillus macyae]
MVCFFSWVLVISRNTKKHMKQRKHLFKEKAQEPFLFLVKVLIIAFAKQIRDVIKKIKKGIMKRVTNCT